jgi:hypothetical protein
LEFWLWDSRKKDGSTHQQPGGERGEHLKRERGKEMVKKGGGRAAL